MSITAAQASPPWTIPAPDGGGLDPTTLAALTEKMAVHAGVEPNARQLSSALSAVELRPDAPWSDRLERAAGAFSLATSRHEASPRELALLGTSHTQWVTVTTSDSGEERWVVVTGSRKKRLHTLIQTGTRALRRTLSPKALGQLLSLSSATAAVPWVAIDPALPLQRLRHDISQGPPSPKLPLQRVRAFLSIEADGVWILLAYAIIVGMLTLATPLTVQVLVNTVAFGTVIQPLVVLTIALFGLLALAGVLKVFEAYVVEIIQRRLFLRTVVDFAHRIPRFDAKVSASYYPPELVNRFFDVMSLQKAAAILLLDGLELFLQALIGMAVLAFYHPLLLAFDALLILSMLIVIFVMGRGAIRTSIAESDAKYAVAAWLEDVARTPITFKSQQGVVHAADRAQELAGDYLDRRATHFRIVYRQIIGTVTTQVMASALLLGLGGWLVITGELTLGQLVAAEIIVSAVVYSIAKFGKQFASFYDAATSATKLAKLVDMPLEPDAGEQPPLEERPMEVRFSEATVKGPTGMTILNGATFEVPRGARVAITGPPCSGKSALLDLLYCLKPLASGRVEVNGVNQRTLAIPAYRNEVGYVRDAEVVQGTIEDNVRVADARVRANDVRRVLEEVDLHDEIARLPDGLRTRLTSTGSPLSDTQRMRLSIARAIVNDPKLLLIDGTLDTLEPCARGRLLDRLMREDAPWTMMIVSHAPDVLARCTHVVHVRDGKVKDVEVHDEP